MKMVNKGIIETRPLPLSDYLDLIQESDIEAKHKTHLLRIPTNNESLALINRALFDYNESLEQSIKHEKRMKKFHNNPEPDEKLHEDFDKFHDYVYSLISLKNYKSKMSKSGKKVALYNVNTLFGNDDEEMLKDVLQEGRLYLWEGLKKYGTLPSKAKNFNGRLDKGHERKKSSKSTFVFQNLKNSYINLGTKSSSKKFKRIDTEFKAEMFGDNLED